MAASAYHVVDMDVGRGVGFRIVRVHLVEIIRILNGIYLYFIYLDIEAGLCR